MKHTILFSMLIGALLVFTGCGGGGGDGGGGGAAQQPTTIAVALTTTGTLPSGNLIRGIDVTLNLPAGVTVNASPSAVNPSVLVPDSNVVVLQGGAVGADKSGITYSSGKVNLILIIPSGISTGSNFAVVNCIVPAGISVSSSNFTITPHTTLTGVFDQTTSIPSESTSLTGVSVIVK